MATAWARAEVILDADGRALPGQVYKYAKEAGDQGGEVLTKEFDKHLTDMGSYQLNRLRQRVKKSGTQSGRILGKSVATAFEQQIKQRLGKAVDEIAQAFTFEGDLDRWAAGFDNVGEASERMRQNLALARQEGRLSADQWRVLNDEWEKAVPRLEAIEREEKRLNTRLVENNKNLLKHASLWKRLSANTRQWTAIIGAVISGMGEMGTLASAAGGGLLVLGGALAAVLTGAGATIAAFAVLTGDIEKLPAALRPARKAFDGLTEAFDDLGDAIAIAAFKDSAEAWESLTSTTRALIPAFERMGTVIGNLFKDFASGVKRNEKGLEQFVDNSSRIFDSLMRTVGRLGEALLIAFNNPTFQKAMDRLTDWIGDLVDDFSGFVQSERFSQWIEDTMYIMGKFTRLLEGAGTVLNNLVDERAVELTGQFLDNLTRFVEGPGASLLEIAKELDIFGLLAKALADFGDALEPLAGPMEDLAIGVNDVIEAGIDTLAPIIRDISEALAPFVQALADFIKANPKEVANGLLAIAGAFAILKGAKVGQAAIDMLAFSTSIGEGGEKIKKFDAKKLGRIGLGIAGVAAAFAVQLIPDDFWDQFDIESNVPQNVLTGAAFGLMFGAWGAVIGAGIGLVFSLFEDFEGTWNDVGNTITSAILGTPMLPAFADFFAQIVPDEWRTSDNPLELAMAAIEQILTDPGSAIVNFPTTFQTAWDQITAGWTTFQTTFSTEWNTFFNVTLPGMWATFWATLNNPEFWFSIADSIGQWAAGLIDGFRLWLIDLAVQWQTFWTSLPTILAAAWGTIMSTLSTWWNAVRTGFVVWLGNLTAPWVNFWNNLTNNPKETAASVMGTLTGWWASIVAGFGSLGATITGAWNGFWNGLVGVVRNVVNTIIGIVNRLFGPIGDALGRLGSLFGMGGGGGSSGRGMASGGILYGPRRILAGEDGPEAIVPLKRTLSRVDPSVRALSAIAQGMTPMASGGVVGGGTNVTIASGAVQINGAVDPQRTALNVVNRLAERIAG